MTQNLKWYQKKNGIIIVLILFFPVGLYLMWKHSDWNNKTKVIISYSFSHKYKQLEDAIQKILDVVIINN